MSIEGIAAVQWQSIMAKQSMLHLDLSWQTDNVYSLLPPSTDSILPSFKKVPSVLIGNKIDIDSRIEVSTREGQMLAADMPGCKFFELCARDGEYVRVAFNDIIQGIHCRKQFAQMASHSSRVEQKRSIQNRPARQDGEGCSGILGGKQANQRGCTEMCESAVQSTNTYLSLESSWSRDTFLFA